MTLNDIYFRLQLLDCIPTKGLPGAALAEIMLLRAKHTRPLNDYHKLMEEAESKLRDEEKYAPLKEEEADNADLKKELEEAVMKMRMDAATEDRYQPLGALSEQTYAAICDAAMSLGTVKGIPDVEGNRPDIPAEFFLAQLAEIIESDRVKK